MRWLSPELGCYTADEEEEEEEEEEPPKYVFKAVNWVVQDNWRPHYITRY
jgi:hypothetical protein